MKAKNLGPELSRPDLDAIPDKFMAAVIEILMGTYNGTLDLSTPRVRSSMAGVYPLVIAMYAVLAVAGIFANFAMIAHIVRNKLHKDPTYTYLINIAISDVIKCVITLPLTLAVLLLENWVLGEFLCYFIPILQDLPIHVSMMTYVLIAGDRYRLLSQPRQPRIPAFVCALSTWFFAGTIVLPHLVYTMYLDLAPYDAELLQGVGMCVTNLIDNIQPYMRSTFLITWIAPLTITAYIYVKTSQELETQEKTLAVSMFETRTNVSGSTHNRTTSNNITDSRIRQNVGTATSGTARLSGLSHTPDLYDVEVDVSKEKRTQKHFIFMVTAFAILFFPLMILKLAKMATTETYENSGYFDYAFTILVWVAFTSTVTTPITYTSWQMSRASKKRLRNYFRRSKRRLTRVPEEPLEMSDHSVSRQGSYTKKSKCTQTHRAGSKVGSTGAAGANPKSRGSSNTPVVERIASFRTSLV